MSAADLSRRNRPYSFSGADADVYTYFPGAAGDTFRQLNSIHTLSMSVHEGKGEARALGFRNVKGFARGLRTIAGSMVLTVVNDHPLRELCEAATLYERDLGESGWSVDHYERGMGTALDQFEYNNRLATLIPPFNMLVQFVTEQGLLTNGGIYRLPNKVGVGGSSVDFSYDGAASMMIEGIEITDVGMVVSVHNIMTEMTVSFRALDFKPLSQNVTMASLRLPITDVTGEHAAIMSRVSGDKADVAVLQPLSGSVSEIGQLGFNRSASKASFPDEDL
jgi:hypothetical protein